MSALPSRELWLGRLHALLWRLRPYLPLLHLRKPEDLVMLLLPALWTVALGEGPASPMALLALLLAASLVRCAAWLYNELVGSATESGPSPLVLLSSGARHDGWGLFILLLSVATLLLLLLDAMAMLWALGALLLLLAQPYIKRRTLLTQVYMGLCVAWIVPMAQLLSQEAAAKPLWLLFTATLLWATANSLLYGIYRRAEDEAEGLGSMVYLFADSSGLAVLMLQLFAVIALWFCGNLAGMGVYFSVALLSWLALMPWQQWLLLRRHEAGAFLAYRSSIAAGVLLLLALLAERL